MDLSTSNLKIFVDTAELDLLRKYASHPLCSGATTNPSLAAKAGIKDYTSFVKEVLSIFPSKPVSLEVIADDTETMRRQAKKLSEFGDNVYVKIPAYNSLGDPSFELIEELGKAGVKVNCTAVMDHETIFRACESLDTDTPSILSVFAGRISDTLRNACTYMRYAVHEARGTNIEVLWASTRHAYNIVEAAECKVHIITLFPTFIERLELQQGKDLHQFEIETSKMFLNDSIKFGFTL